MKNIIVIGGAGYIGSACTRLLCDGDFNVVVVDNLSTGFENSIDKRAEFKKGDIRDKNFLNSAFEGRRFDAIMHFAAHKDARKSMTNLVEYSENIQTTINVLNYMVESDISRIIFSSTAAVYGNPQYVPIDEKHSTKPINYYGFTKLVCEQIIEWYSRQCSFDFSILRYFNVVGDVGIKHVELHGKNLFPRIVQSMQGRGELNVFGDDYHTMDGTAIRDYVHIRDIARAHLLALTGDPNIVVNLGSKSGFTVLEIIDAFEKLSGMQVPYIISPRRDGDPEKIVSSHDRATEVLGWKPEESLKDMVVSTLSSYGLL